MPETESQPQTVSLSIPFDLTSYESCREALHVLEHEAYSAIISAFRAQGELSWEKIQCLEDLRGHLHISEQYHRSEVQRVNLNASLVTIAKR